MPRRMTQSIVSVINRAKKKIFLKTLQNKNLNQTQGMGLTQPK